MGDPAMPLSDDDVRRVADYMRPFLKDIVVEMMPRAPERDVAIGERLVELTGELKAQREVFATELSAQRELTEARFVALDERLDRRDAEVDRRFEDLIALSDRRFDAVDKRVGDLHRSIGRLQWLIGVGFLIVTTTVTVFGFLA